MKRVQSHSSVEKGFSVEERIESDYYTSPKHEYPSRPMKPEFTYKGYTSEDVERFLEGMKKYEEEMLKFYEKVRLYDEDLAFLEKEFHEDLMDEFGLRGHPKESLLYSMACKRGTLYAIYESYSELSELLK